MTTAAITETTTARLLKQIHNQYRLNSRRLPDKKKTQQWLDGMIELLFPSGDEELFSSLQIKKLQLGLQELLEVFKQDLKQPATLVKEFFRKIPTVFQALQKDAQAILAFDPAAGSIDEVVISYPGFYAITAYRIAHELHRLHIPIIPRLIAEYAHSATGIDINPGAVIGEAFFIDHGTGVVIGETCILGNHVKIYQGVTLGALNVSKSDANKKRHPTIEDNVVIYAGTTILGGNTVIGHDSVIGGNVWLTNSVPAYSLVYHKSEIRVRNNHDFDEPINFVI